MMKYKPDNIFARIIRKEIPAKIAFEDDLVLAIHDIQPRAPIHILVLPKLPCCSFDDFIVQATDEQALRFFQTVQKIAASHNLVESGYRLVMNHGENSGQEVFHFHVHILGGKHLPRHSIDPLAKTV